MNYYETFRDLLIRHTFGNPRELVYLLVNLGEKVKTNIEEEIEFNIQDYAYFIDEKANVILFGEHFSTECLPSFPDNQLLDFLFEIRKNYFSLSAKIYLTHPCLDYMLADINADFYYPYCIIGHGRPFIFKRGLSYYMPKNIPRQGNCYSQIQEKFQLFYDSEFSISSFTNIPNRIKSAYTALLLSACDRERGLSALNQHISDQIATGILSCSRDDDIKLLERNIKVRLVFAIGVFLDIYKKGQQVYSFFEEINPNDPSQTVYNVSFTQSCYTPNRGINKEKVAQSLSDYEWSVISDFYDSNEVKNFIDTSSPKRKEVLNKRIETLKQIDLELNRSKKNYNIS